MRICVLGNSIPLLVNPYRVNYNQKTYGEYLREEGFEVKICARQSSMITDLYKTLEEDCISFFPDFVILHFGIVECTYRTKTRFIQSILNANAWKNTFVHNRINGKYQRIFFFLIKKIIRKLDHVLHFFRLHYRWVNPELFHFALNDIIKSIYADTNTKGIILVGMLNGYPWLEKEARGTIKSIKKYNAILNRVSQNIEGVYFVDVNTYLKNDTETSSDGIHFTSLSHSVVTKEILNIIANYSERSILSWKNISPVKMRYK